MRPIRFLVIADGLTARIWAGKSSALKPVPDPLGQLRVRVTPHVYDRSDQGLPMRELTCTGRRPTPASS
ncbi:hypothetical protein J2Z21_001313 [Streptomyces griseochromogenes]|uniref:Uncharacterized protein n=1 Tax=Streptomyces griseochromogenes TaxID=68214 RepID=A0ABS4LLX3_9ACTN|nr:hypothetical protein [Streptomyces griseochromogenes]